ncbi:ImuA family protein [Oceaniglobus trochenteri]|uniref:ImuA family protein n=1 Tax=Oceaniglobus trochenteri TaxID=2763260 RepID=UPI001CFFEC55|nr:hypothetical protein [Oceaniglobus trochenteri]
MSNTRNQRPTPLSCPEGHTLSEVFSASATDAAAIGFLVARLPRADAPLFWVQDRFSQQEAGQPYLPGLAGRRIIRADLNRPVDVLWAMEEGLRCTSLAAVIGEVWGNPRALDFTATKRLVMRAERHGVPCWLIRRGAAPDLSSARNRWRVLSLPSQANPDDPGAPGDPRWQVELFRSRHMRPGTWIATHDRAADRVDLTAPFRDGAVAQDDGAPERRAAR